MSGKRVLHMHKTPGLHSRTATRADEGILQQFCRDNPTDGSVNFCLLREPGFFSALEVEGSKNDVAVVYDHERLVGMGLRSEKDVYINGKKEKLGTYSGVRILREYQGSQVFLRMARIAREFHEKSDCKIYLANIFTDNTKALDAFVSPGRTHPAFRSIGNYITHIFRPDLQKPVTTHSDHLMIRKAGQDDIEDLITFYTKQGENRQYFPVYTVDHLLKDGGLLKGLSADSIFIAWHKNRIIGTMALWDQSSFRYWMVKSYSGMLSFLRPLINTMVSLRKQPGFPPPGKPVDYNIISLCCIDENHPDAFAPLLNEVLLGIRDKRSVYAAIGFHESDPLLKLFNLPAFKMVSRLYKVYWPEDSQFAEQIDNRNPYFELGSL